MQTKSRACFSFGMLIFSPNAEAAERGVTLKALMKRAEDKSSDPVLLHGTAYHLAVIPSLGVWLTITPARESP